MGSPEAPSPPSSSTSSYSDRTSKSSDTASPRTGSSTGITERPLSPLQSVGPISLQPSPTKDKNHKKKSSRFFRQFRTVVRSLPIITPAGCKIPIHGAGRPFDGRVHGGTRVTGTLFGHRKARINLAFQENPRCLPMLVMELAVQTGKIFQDFREGIVRIALECEKHAPSEKTKIMEEPIWTMYCNGKKSGYGIRREATQEDLSVMQVLSAASMGVGVVPSDPPEAAEGDLVYMRASFERVVGSRDSETYYMVNPDDNTGPEVTIFFVRI